MQPHALVRFPNDTYVEYLFDSTHGVYGNIPYPSTENLLSYGPSGYVEDEGCILLGGFSSGEVLPLNANYESWALTVGSDWDCIFYGCNAQGSVLAHGDLASMHTWARNLTVPKSRTRVNWFAQPISFGLLLRASEFSDSLHFLQAEGVFPQLPLDMALTPVVVDDVLYRSYRPW